MNSRKFEETLAKGFMIGSLILVLGILAAIVLVIVLRGASSLILSMLTETPKGGYYLGQGGGIANAIVGSLSLAFGASFLSLLLGLPNLLLHYRKEYLGRHLVRITRLSLDILWGTPSIVYGAFGFIVMVYFGLSASLLGGIIALTLLMLPIVTRSIEEVIRMIPIELKEISYSLGATRIETTLSVVLRQALPGIVTGVLLAQLAAESGMPHPSSSPPDTPIIFPGLSLTRSLPFPLPSFSKSPRLSLRFNTGLMPPLVLLVIVLIVSIGSKTAVPPVFQAYCEVALNAPYQFCHT